MLTPGGGLCGGEIDRLSGVWGWHGRCCSRRLRGGRGVNFDLTLWQGVRFITLTTTVPQPEVGGDEAAAGGRLEVVEVGVHLKVGLRLPAEDLHLVLVQALVENWSWWSPSVKST